MKALGALFDVIPGLLWALLLAGALALVGVKTVQLGQARLDLAQYKLAAAEAAVQAGKKQKEALDASILETRQARDAAAGSARALGRLRGQLEKLRSGIRAATADGGATGGDPIGVLSDVLGRCSQRVQRLGEIADDARLAGKLCERSYDALTAN